MSPEIIKPPSFYRASIESQFNAIRETLTSEYRDARHALERQYRQDISENEGAKREAFLAIGFNADGTPPSHYPQGFHIHPELVADPTIDGVAALGETWTANPGTWTGYPPLTFTYRWRRAEIGGVSPQYIEGATESTYETVEADGGKVIGVVVNATNGVDDEVIVPSTWSSTIVPPIPVNTVAPVVTGTPVAGNDQTTTDGTWDYETSVTYQWQSQNGDGTGPISTLAGEVGPHYTPLLAGVGKKFRCVVTAHNIAGTAEAISNWTATITSP